MCGTCDAGMVINSRITKKAGEIFQWKDAPPEISLEVESTCERAEFTEGMFRMRRGGGEWSPWLLTNDLSGTMTAYGTDVKFKYVKHEVKSWLQGEGDFPMLGYEKSEEQQA